MLWCSHHDASLVVPGKDKFQMVLFMQIYLELARQEKRSPANQQRMGTLIECLHSLLDDPIFCKILVWVILFLTDDLLRSHGHIGCALHLRDHSKTLRDAERVVSFIAQDMGISLHCAGVKYFLLASIWLLSSCKSQHQERWSLRAQKPPTLEYSQSLHACTPLSRSMARKLKTLRLLAMHSSSNWVPPWWISSR